MFWGTGIVFFLAKFINLHNDYTQGFWVELCQQVETGMSSSSLICRALPELFEGGLIRNSAVSSYSPVITRTVLPVLSFEDDLAHRFIDLFEKRPLSFNTPPCDTLEDLSLLLMFAHHNISRAMTPNKSASSTPPTRRKRPHTKSRRGCLNCKARKVKVTINWSERHLLDMLESDRLCFFVLGGY